ncbi:MAG TPA: hypothetical protein VHT51_13800, partial [Micropepsaceae bacterium]|nr:hypothetical protein [Micropepsaceae bacterium]
MPTYAFSEDAKTKDLERVALNESDGSDLALGAKLGALTETAPATDTASSGLNGRLQRIAQRLTSVIGLLPAALGAGGGMKVDGSGTALPVSAASLPLPTGAATETSVAASSSALGMTSGTAVITDANGTIQQYVRGLIKQWVAGTLVLGAGSNVIGHVVVDSGSVTATT